MANRKISDLTALTTTATGDLLPIIDISEAGAVDQNKKITVQNLFQAIPVDVGVGEGSSGAGISIKNRLAALPTTGTNANIAWLESTSGFAAGSLLLGSRPSTGSVVLSANGAANLVIAPSTGNVGIGTSSPGTILHTVNTSAGAATVGAFIQNSSLTAGTEVRLGFAPNTNTVADNRYSWIGAINGTGSNDSSLTFATTPGGTGATERMRIDSSGRVGIGTSSIYSSTRADVYTDNGSWFVQTFRQDNATGYGIGIGSDSTALAYFYPNSGLSGAPVGGITHDGSSTTYATSSDYRLKENVVPLTGAINRVNDLQVRRFNFIVDPDHTVDGFIAHEAQAVVPECVTGTKDKVDDDGNPVYQGIDQSKLVPLLTAALQEAIAKIETLEARLTAAGIA
jgi:hypothetical protein